MSYQVDFHNFLVLRTPLLPFAATQDLSEETLRALLQNPLLIEAIFVASPDLALTVQAWLNHASFTNKDNDRLLITLRKYLLRMAYRCTPYGLFAGISRGVWGPNTSLHLAPFQEYVRCSRLDMDYLCSLATALAQDVVVREHILYYPNNTLYTVGDQYRYVECNFQQKIRRHDLVTVDRSEFLESILCLAQKGQTAEKLTQSLVSPEISLEEAQEFLSDIIDSQLLVSELEPAVTGQNYLRQLMQVLQRRLSAHPMLTHLALLDQQLTALDQTFGGNTFNSYHEIRRLVEQQGTAFEANHLLQVDMLKPTRGHTLNKSVQVELSKVIQLLHGLKSPQDDDPLQKFRAAFTEQYDQQEIPLLQVLDMEMGIGYPIDRQASTDPAPLLNDLPIDAQDKEPVSLKWTAWQAFLMEKYLRVVDGRDAHVVLTDAEVQPFLSQTAKPLASSLYCMGSLLASSAQALDQGDFQMVHYATSGPSAANLLGRFCHLDAGLTADVQEALRLEEKQHPETIFAEVVHLNQSRIGNIAMRPVLRSYEIPILAQAGVGEAYTIPLDDLRLSVKGDHLVLRSARLNRQIIPRLSSAHNFALNALPAYHFLCALQFQGTSQSVAWNWGLLQQAAFLPRVVYGKTILSEAKWRLSQVEIDYFSKVPEYELLEAAKKLREARGLPSWIVVSESDNKLPIRLDSLPHLQVLQALMKRAGRMMVEECLYNLDNLVIEGAEGGYTNEFILPLRIVSELPAQSYLSPEIKVSSVALAPPPARAFSLGSEWLYVKLYCGLQTADHILVEVVLPLVQRLQQQGTIDSWFFIRYRDTHNHLRVRFHGAEGFYGQVISALHQALAPYVQANLLFSLRTDTYQRELERYGPGNMLQSETLFHHDSEATLEVIAMLGGQESEQMRWLLAMRSVDTMLNDFGRSAVEKLHLMSRLQQGFKVELKSTSAVAKKAFGNKYRQVRAQIELVLNPMMSADDELAPALEVFAKRSQKWAPVIAAMLRQSEEGTLEISVDTLLSHYTHMLLNRFFRSKQRQQEAVIYDFLHQHYTSQVARTAKSLLEVELHRTTEEHRALSQ